MRKPREEGRSTRSSGSRTRPVNKNPAAPKLKPKTKAKPQPNRKQGKDVERPVQVTVIRVRNPKTSKNIIQGGVSKQKNRQKKKTSAVVGALKEDLLKKLAEKVDDKFSGVVNTLLEVAVVSKKVIPRKKTNDDEAVHSSHQDNTLKREQSPNKQQVKPKKEAPIDTKTDSYKDAEKKSSKDSDKKTAVKETKKQPVKEEKKTVTRDDKKTEKKVTQKTPDKKLTKKTEKKVTVFKAEKKVVKEQTKESKKVTRGAKNGQTESKKKLQLKTKSKDYEDSSKNVKADKAHVIESNKKDLENAKKEALNLKKESDSKRDNDDDKKINDTSKKDNVKKDKDSSGHGQQKSSGISKKEPEDKKDVICKDEDPKKSKNVKEDDSKRLKMSKDEDSKDNKKVKNVMKDDEPKKLKESKEEEVKKGKLAKGDESKVQKKNVKKATTPDVKKPAESKVNSKKTTDKEKPKISPKKDLKKSPTRQSSKSREKIVKEDKKPTKKYVKRKPKIETELDGSAKISQILNTPKRHREASLNALAKVHCLYENESRGVIMDIIDKSEKMFKEEKRERALKSGKAVVEEDKKEPEEIPVRNLRTAPGLRSVGRHWEILNASSSSSEDSSDSASERKSIEDSPPPESPPKVLEKKVKRRRKRSEVVMDLKDMVVKKRMASLNASAMMAATYSTDRRSNRSDDDSNEKSSDSRESSSTPEVVDVEETSDDEVILGGRKKALVIVNQDTADLTITGVYVNSTTRSTRHEGFCSIAGMQYRISSTSHTQTETAVSTETTVIHTEHGESSRTGGSDGGSSCKTYTPLGALSNMQPPGSPRYPPSPSSSAFSAPPHQHAHHQDIHGYFQPAGPLITSSQLKAGPSQVDEMQASSSQAVPYSSYAAAGYLEPPGYPPAYPKYPPPPGYSPHRRYYFPPIEPPYPPPYPHPHYYSPYTPPPQPPPHYRPAPYIDSPFQPCPCPMPQTCPKNVHTGPLTGTSKGSESNSTVPPVGASRGPVQLNPVALGLPPEPGAAANPPSPARGSAGLPPPASPALAQASWGTPPPPQSPGLLTASEPQPRRKRRRTSSISPPPLDRVEKVSEEPPDKLIRPVERVIDVKDKYEGHQNPINRFVSDKTILCNRLQPPAETFIQANCRMVNSSDCHSQIKPTLNQDTLHQSNLFNDKMNDRLSHVGDKVQQQTDRNLHLEKVTKNKSPLHCEKVSDRSVHSSDKAVHIQAGRTPHPSDVLSHSNDRLVHSPEKPMLLVSRTNHISEKDQNLNRPLPHERFIVSERLTQPSLDRASDRSIHGNNQADQLKQIDRVFTAATDRSLKRLPQLDRTKSINEPILQERVARPSERTVPPVSDLQNSHSPPEGDVPCNDKAAIIADEPRRKRSSSRESATNTPKRRISVNKRTSRPKKLPSPAEADVPPKRNSRSPENKVKKACVPLKNSRRIKDFTESSICREIVETASLASLPTLKWSNGWSWRGEPFTASVYIRDDRTEVRKCYPSMEHREGDIIHPRDCILLKSAGSRKNLPFVAKVAALWENPDDGEMMVSLLWYYRPEHTEQGRQPHQPPDEVFASKHKDSNSVACIEDKCYVLTFNEYCRYMKRCRQMDTGSRGWSPVPKSDISYPRQNRIPPGRVSRDLVFFCRKVYDFRFSRILKNPC